MDFEGFFIAIDRLIELNARVRAEYSENIHEYEPEHFAELFATVSVDIGRLSGKSAYIQSRATKDDLVISDNQRLASRFSKDLTVKTAIQVIKHKDDGSLASFNRVFIDDASCVFNTVSKQTLYKALASGRSDQTFIRLG
jgi:hypothetical protein